MTAPVSGLHCERPAFASEAEELADLVERCLSGEEAAWQAFVERFQEPIFSLCYRMLRHRQDAEDVAQEALVRAIQNLHIWDPARSIMPWLMTITANRCRTALVRRKRMPIAIEFPAERLEAGEEFEAGTNDGWGASEEISRALGNLRAEYRECFILFYQQELTCEEIGDVLGCPTGTVKTWLHRARRELAAQLARRGIHGSSEIPHSATAKT